MVKLKDGLKRIVGAGRGKRLIACVLSDIYEIIHGRPPRIANDSLLRRTVARSKAGRNDVGDGKVLRTYSERISHLARRQGRTTDSLRYARARRRLARQDGGEVHAAHR